MTDFVPLDAAVGLKTITARDLQRIVFPPINYVVPDYLVEGLTLLAGKPKLGKSWLALDWGLAVAYGGVAMGSIACEGGNVLYAAMEDNRRRLQRRIEQLVLEDSDWPGRLDLATEMRRLDDGGIDDLHRWADAADNPRLIVLDTLACVRPPRSTRDSSYESDYAAIGPLQKFAGERGLAVVLIHHLRKMDADDPLDTVSGTTGLTGAVDTVLVLTRDSQGCTLYGRGRDIDEIETAMEFDKLTGRWAVLGPASDVRRSDERQSILAVLAEAGEAMQPNEIAAELDVPSGNIRRLIQKMARAGDVTKASYGKYTLGGGNTGNGGNTS